jgi:hypothetical protein
LFDGTTGGVGAIVGTSVGATVAGIVGIDGVGA